MSDDVTEPEFDAVAAEYVLGSLDASERAHTHMLLGIDEAFAARVKLWERRLGELHLMVEPVEPDWRVYERVKQRIGGFQANPFYAALGARMGEDGLPLQPPAPDAAATLPADAPPAVPPQTSATDIASAFPPQPAEPQAPTPPAPPPQPQTGGLWDVAPAETAPPEPEVDAAPSSDTPAPAAAEDVAQPAPAIFAAGQPALEASATPADITPAASAAPAMPAEITPAASMVPAETPAVESPPLQTPEPSREPTIVDPRGATALAQPPESERTIPFLEARVAPVILPAAQMARDADRWRRSVRQWRAFAMAMTVLALCLGGFVAALRNFPERLPPLVRAQFPALAVAGGDFQRARRAAPPESQFDE